VTKDTAHTDTSAELPVVTMELAEDLAQGQPGRAGLTVLYAPGFCAEDELRDQYCRLLWYLQPMLGQIDKVYVAADFEPEAEFPLPAYFDPAICGLADGFRSKVVLFDSLNASRWHDLLERAGVILHWNVHRPLPDRRAERLLHRARRRGRVYNVDHVNNRYGGSSYLRVSQRTDPCLKSHVAECRRKFAQMAAGLGHPRKGYIFGTGPSLAKAMEMDFSDGLVIACNSMVVNKPLLENLQPKMLTVADPVFHAGCSRYAGAFRRQLVQAMDAYGCHLIVPFRDYKVYMHCLPERFHNRIIGVPFKGAKRINVDLSRRFWVKSISNILTIFLIPLASTLCDEVGIAGCDGRPIEEDKYFWAHDRKSQFPDDMESARQAQPGFFSIDYNDYYLEHCRTLELWLRAAERAGTRFFNLTESHIPALVKRSRAMPKANDGRVAGYAPLVSVVLCNYNYGRYVGEAIASVLGQTYDRFEFIIVDDASTDDSRHVITSYADPRISTFFHKENRGQAAAFNTGFAAAHGEIVAFLDSDDTWKPDKLARVVAAFGRNGDVALVQHNLDVIDSDSKPMGQVHPGIRPGRRDVPTAYVETDHVGYFTPTSGVSCRRDVLDRIFPIDESWRICADVAVCVPAAMFGDTLTLERNLASYRIHGKNTWMNSPERQERLPVVKKYAEYANAWLAKLGYRRRIRFQHSGFYYYCRYCHLPRWHLRRIAAKLRLEFWRAVRRMIGLLGLAKNTCRAEQP
jgi:glycosyltransferase involved in cell wall biosynthesis